MTFVKGKVNFLFCSFFPDLESDLSINTILCFNPFSGDEGWSEVTCSGERATQREGGVNFYAGKKRRI